MVTIIKKITLDTCTHQNLKEISNKTILIVVKFSSDKITTIVVKGL